MTPNMIVNKLTAHELQTGLMPKDKPSTPSSPTPSIALSCKNLKKVIKESSSEDDDDESCTSEREEMDSDLIKQVSKMNKCLKEINLMGYKVTLRDGLHHQEMKVERIKYKLKSKAKKEKMKKHKQVEKEERPRHENFAVFCEWVSEGEESATSSSDDESSKSFTTWLNVGTSSTPRFCLMAKGCHVQF